MLQDILSSSPSMDKIIASYEVQSNLSQMTPSDSEEAQIYSTRLTQTNFDILASNLDCISEISADLIHLKV